MILWKLARFSWPAAFLALGLLGCLPPGSNPADEQNEPHFRAGKTRVSSLDFQGAIESFEKALEVNPRSASAHFELGWLFDEKNPDPAAAIYHYEKYLKLHPNAGNAELVRQRIGDCKQDLAKAVLPLPVTPSLQREFGQLAEENKRLKEELVRWQAYAAGQPRVPTNTPTPVLVMTRPAGASGNTLASPGGAAGTSTPTGRSLTTESTPIPAVRQRAYTVKAGDSPYSIAKQHRVKLDALLAANPKLDPKRLKVGQSVIIPAN